LHGLAEGWYYLTNDLEGLKKKINGEADDKADSTSEKKGVITDLKGTVINLVDENNQPVVYEPTKTVDDAGNPVILADGDGNPITVVDANGARIDTVARTWPNG
jgi:hypothetical protein